MDTYFPDYWGNFLVKSADGEKQIDYWSRMVGSGLKSMEELTALYWRACGAVAVCENTPQNLDMWKSAQEEWSRSVRDYLNLLGFIPKDEYLALSREKDALKASLKAQEDRYAEASRQFDRIFEKQKEQAQTLEAGAASQVEKSKQLDALMNKQSEQIQKLESREAFQAETTKQLEALLKKQSEQIQKLKAKEINHAEAAKQLEDMMKKQKEQFQSFLDKIADMLKMQAQPGEG